MDDFEKSANAKKFALLFKNITNKLKNDSDPNLMRKAVDELEKEKDLIFAAMKKSLSLSDPISGYPSFSGGYKMNFKTINELTDLADFLDEILSLVSSFIDNMNGIINKIPKNIEIPDYATITDKLIKYMESLLELQRVCAEYRKSIQQMINDLPIHYESLLMAKCEGPTVPDMGCCYSPIGSSDMFSGLSNAVPPPSIDSVQFSAIAAGKIERGKYLPVSIAMYEDAFREAVDDIVSNYGKDVKEKKSGYHDVARNSLVRVVLSSSDVLISDDEEVQRWNGKYLIFDFVAKVPKEYAEDQILLIATIYVNDLIATKLKLVVDCENKEKHNISIERQDIFSAFVSYASHDRNRVASIIQGMKKARPDMDIFFDVENLRSGQLWEEALKTEIDNRDILFLCWSKYAKESKWVEKEWRYALESKGENSIEPIPIDSPDVCPPPAELIKKHFNDKLLFIINATVSGKMKTPYLLNIKNNECITIDKLKVEVGKDEENADIVISGNPAVSRRHAIIFLRGNNFYIIDLNSTNHTYVDGKAIPSGVDTLIGNGSKVTFANEEFIFFC